MSTYFYRDRDHPVPNRPRRVTVVALIEDRGRLLFDRRIDAPFWGLIAGHLEDDETLVDGLRREVHEETGLSVSHYSLFGTFSDPTRVVQYADGATFPLVTIAYRVNVDDVTALRLSSESQGFRFFTPDEIQPDEVIATQRPIIERFLSGASPPFLD